MLIDAWVSTKSTHTHRNIFSYKFKIFTYILSFDLSEFFSALTAQCIDKVPPSIKCPSDIVTQTAKGQNYAYVNWSTPEVTDNTDESPILWTKPHVTFPWKTKIGTRIIVYIAQDASGNKARCKFKVKVLGMLYSEIRK